MKEFSISVVVPTYNSSQTIERAILSVSRQTFLPLEIIIIDDHSHDNTLEIIENLKLNVDLIILKNEKNHGPSISRNRGIEISRGEWIAFLDSDDYWHPQKLEIQKRLLSTTGHHFVGSIATYGVEPNSHLSSTLTKVKEISPLKMMWKNYFHTPTVLVRKSTDLKFSSEMLYAEDFELWTKIIKKYGKALYMEEPLTYLGKPPFINGGLSSHLTRMELGELSVIWREGAFLVKVPAIIFSLLKFIRRLLKRFIARLS